VTYDLIWSMSGRDSTTVRVTLFAEELIFDQKLLIPHRET